MKPLIAVLRQLAFILLLPVVAVAQGILPIRTVARPVQTMFSSATSDAEVVSQAIYATRVTVLEEHETPMVRIDNLNDPHWAKLLVAARRIKP